MNSVLSSSITDHSKDKTKTIAILYICTGEYAVFWDEFYKSFEKHFIKEDRKTYFVFTDYAKEYFDHPNVEVIEQKRLGWPYDTLMRFDMFSKVIDKIKNFDYVFFMNANMKCMQDISAKEFLPLKEELLFVLHPGFWNKPRRQFTYEHRRKSTACITKKEGIYYVCGGVNGGKTSSYIQLILTLKKNIERDLNHNVIAVWHDESHINRYVADHNNYRILGPEYCYPEGWDLPFQQKILVRDKANYINVHKIKGERFGSCVKRWIKACIPRKKKW